jgi:UDPglucose 6-dehydrogenase
MRRLSIIGAGYVGLVTAVCLADKGFNVICVDNDEGKINKLNNHTMPIYEEGLDDLCVKNHQAHRIVFTTDIKFAVENSDVIYISVGTPSTETGEADLSFVVSAVTDIAKYLNGYKIIVNKSTVPVGTQELVKKIVSSNSSYDFDVVSNPEFLREGTAIHDTIYAERIVIGCESKKSEEIMKDIYSCFNSPILIVNPRTAEMIKYAANTFLALKVSYINEIANICDLVGADVLDVSKGIGMDDRIGKKFLNAGIGFGGACFPKDVLSIYSIANKNGYKFKLAETLLEINETQKVKPVDKLLDIFSGDIKGKKIAILGLSFKPGTDDMRGAPSIKIIESLYSKGADITAYDPMAIENAKKIINYPITYCYSIRDAINSVDVIIICTEWNDISNIDLYKIKDKVKNKIIIDGRNCINKSKAQRAGFRYFGIGVREDIGYKDFLEVAITND